SRQRGQVAGAVIEARFGFDHGAGHPLLFLDDAKVPNCQKNNGFKDLGNYSEWPKVAGAVIQAVFTAQKLKDLRSKDGHPLGVNNTRVSFQTAPKFPFLWWIVKWILSGIYEFDEQ